MKKAISLFFTVLFVCLCVLPAAAFSPGDVNADGRISAEDARLALRASVGLETYAPGSEAFLAADADGNAVLSAADARLILRAAVGLEELSGRELTSTEVYKRGCGYTYEIRVSTKEYDAIGSGFAIDDAGSIATNYHVVKDAQTLKVYDYNGVEYDVKEIVAVDRRKDIAIIRIDAATSPAVLNRSAYETGDTVYTLGSSNGYRGTFAHGVVSNRSIVLEDYNPDMTYIQTSAPISGGNSGGPLIDTRGRVIGMNTLTDAEGQNLNFAIPVTYLDALDRSSPMDLSAFADAERNYREVYLYYGKAEQQIRVGGTAAFFLNVTAKDAVTPECVYNKELLRADLRNGCLCVAALAACEREPVVVRLREHPEVSCTVYVTASPQGKTTFGFFEEAPDLGAMTGVAPTFSALSAGIVSVNTLYPMLTYRFSGADVRAETVRGAYFAALAEAGFTQTRRNALTGTYFFENEKTSATVVYGETSRFGVLREAYVQIL